LSGRPPSEPFRSLKRATRCIISSRLQFRISFQSLMAFPPCATIVPGRSAMRSFLTFFIFLLITGCAAQPPAPQTVNVIVFPGGFNWPIWVAKEKGLFAKNGLDVKLTPTPSSVFQLTNLIEGKFDIAMTAIDNLIAYREGQGEAKVDGPDLIAFMGCDNGFLRLVAVPEIRTLDDLRNKTVSVDARTTGYAFVLFEMLERGGLRLDRDYNGGRAGGVLQRFQALMEKKHDATLLLSPFELQAEAKGLTRPGNATDVLCAYQGLVGGARTAWAGANRAAVGTARGASTAPRGVSHGWDPREHGRRVLLRESLRNRGGVDRGGGVERRRRHAEPGGELADDLHVLLPHLVLHGGVVVAAGDHLRAAHLEHARCAGAVAGDAVDGLGIEPGLHAEHERLRGRHVVDRHQQVGDELHLAAVAELAQVVMRARETFQDRNDFLEGLLIAACVDHQIPRPRLRTGARERAVEQGLSHHVPRFQLVLDRQGAGFDNNSAFQVRRYIVKSV